MLPKKDNAVGLDLGIRYLIADSNGGIVENPRHAKKSSNKLARAQRKLAKCKKDSTRRKKARRLVARIHERIANQRKDTLHKASRRYVDAYQTLVIENLKPANMVRNHCLAFAISDASWGMFRHFLESKAESAGRLVIAVAPHYTSQKCSQCKEVVYKSLSVRTHVCSHCGYIADRDENAAKNILRAGMLVQARTGPSSREREGPAYAGESPLPLKREAAGLRDHAECHRSVSKSIVLVALTGWLILDPIIALLVALNIVWTGIRLLRETGLGLLDTALPLEDMHLIEHVLDTYRAQGLAFHALRTRQAGSRRFISFHVLVPGNWTVLKGHTTCETIELALHDAFPETTVFTHLEPLEDPASFIDQALDRAADTPPTSPLPLKSRDQVK